MPKLHPSPCDICLHTWLMNTGLLIMEHRHVHHKNNAVHTLTISTHTLLSLRVPQSLPLSSYFLSCKRNFFSSVICSFPCFQSFLKDSGREAFSQSNLVLLPEPLFLLFSPCSAWSARETGKIGGSWTPVSKSALLTMALLPRKDLTDLWSTSFSPTFFQCLYTLYPCVTSMLGEGSAGIHFTNSFWAYQDEAWEDLS